MRPEASLKADLEPHSMEHQPASGSSNLVKPPAKLAALCRGHPAFSDVSSETDYTSSASSEEALLANENVIQSKLKDQPNQAPQENLVPKSEIESENLVAPIQRLGSRCTIMERHKIDRNGKAIEVVDLGDSDDETEPPLKHEPHKEHEQQVTEAVEKDVTLVVDLKVASSQVNHRHVGTIAPFSSKANGKHVDVSKERTITVFVKDKVETKLTLSKLVAESSLQPRLRIAVETEVLNASVERVRETEESEDEASTISEDYRRGHAEGNHAEETPPDWSPGVLCDLCERRASLTLGPWYSWCCGNPSLSCHCSPDDLQRKRKSLLGKGGKNWKTTDPPYPWSGKVHKLCGLWSAEVFEDSEQPSTIMKLGDAVKRSRKIKCSDPDCGLFGATLGCRVASCRRSFHYPCADRLSALVKVRMWDGLMKPVACTEHRHVNDSLNDLKLQKESKKRKRGKKGLVASSGAGSSKSGVRTLDDADVIQIESSGEEESPHGATVQDVIRRPKTPNNLDPRHSFTKTADTSDSWLRGRNAGPAYFGKNLLCKDFASGLEPIEVPCTNDVDSESPPYLEYITKSRYQGEPLGSNNCPHPLLERQAKACDGCALHDPDNPLTPLSVHIPFQRREDDYREDWLRERMYGRLPYDQYARLVIGTDYNELVECNDRCKCGDHCINKEMQKGLRTPIELYKTVNKGWAVRTLIPIPRGRFVIEYVGEMLTQDQAQRYGQMYDEIKRSYLYDLDYPESKRTPDFTLDGFHASNVARFINHSCDANLKIYRVYVETTYKWRAHIGMYAMRDIEAGEELSYDYNYGRHELQAHDGKSNSAEAGKQRAEQENDSTHIKCYCGAKNCREWLWRPVHTGEDSEDE